MIEHIRQRLLKNTPSVILDPPDLWIFINLVILKNAKTNFGAFQNINEIYLFPAR